MRKAGIRDKWKKIDICEISAIFIQENHVWHPSEGWHPFEGCHPGTQLDILAGITRTNSLPSAMNFLAHLFLAGDDESMILGNMIADFIRHGDEEKYSKGIQRGIWLHRRIDSFTDPHPVVLKSIRRIDSRFRLLKGIMVDLFYDHFLACHWNDYSPMNLETFTERMYTLLHANEADFPPRLRRILPYMSGQNWLVSYREIEGIEQALGGISRRISRPNRLGEGGDALRAYYTELESDFREFFPLLQEFVNVIEFPANLSS